MYLYDWLSDCLISNVFQLSLSSKRVVIHAGLYIMSLNMYNLSANWMWTGRVFSKSHTFVKVGTYTYLKIKNYLNNEGFRYDFIHYIKVYMQYINRKMYLKRKLKYKLYNISNTIDYRIDYKDKTTIYILLYIELSTKIALKDKIKGWLKIVSFDWPYMHRKSEWSSFFCWPCATL